jgi:hypothetical protein
MKGAAEKLMAFWRLDKHRFSETPHDSMRDADSFDFGEIPQPDSGGIAETRAQAEAGDPSCLRPSHRRPQETLSL